MVNKEQVIKGLEHEVARTDLADLEWLDCVEVGLLRDALALLKAQEPMKPIMHYVPDGKRSSAAWQCGNCLIDIGYGANYCYNCGRAVKWK